MTIKKVLTIIGILYMMTGISLSSHANTAAERIAPVGKVCMSGDECAASSNSQANTKTLAPGQELYEQRCAACHNSGIANAPKLGDAAGWALRLDKGLDNLYASAVRGIGIMPAKGGCGSCSDEEIAEAVDYILDNSK